MPLFSARGEQKTATGSSTGSTAGWNSSVSTPGLTTRIRAGRSSGEEVVTRSVDQAQVKVRLA